MTITKRQKELLSIVYQYIENNGYPPTFEEMKERLGVSSNQSILDLLTKLEEKKYIKKEEGMARGLKILRKGFEELGVQSIIPYVGISAAGPYTQIFDDIQWKTAGDVELITDMLVKIKGDSMINADINDGDIVLIREAKEFKSGDIVLARNNDETTIKRFIHDDGKVYLKPENPKYSNIPIYPDTRLIGKVIRIIRKDKDD